MFVAFTRDAVHSYRRAMMEKEDEGAGEGAEDDGSEAKGEPGGPMDTVTAQAQDSISQLPPRENEMRDTLMEDAETLTDLSNSPMLP